jgi:hypothetical protein
MKCGYVSSMPSKTHDGIINFIRDRPAFAAELLSDALHINLPEHTVARLQSADLTEVSSTEFRADAVIALDGRGKTSAAIVTEIQLRPDDDKRYSWPVYLTTLRARLQCPVYLLVISPSRRAAKWCAEPIDCGHPGFVLRPFTIGPDQIPGITDHGLAAKSLELAMLSAMAHGQLPENHKVLDAAIAAISSVDRDRGRRYYDILLAAVPEAGRRYLENRMTTSEYRFTSETFLRMQAEAMLKMMTLRGIAVSDSIRERIMNVCKEQDVDEFDKLLAKAATANYAHELFA